MGNAADRARTRGAGLERAGRRAQAFAARVMRLDAHVGLARLLGSVVYLAILASFFSRWDAAGKTLSILSFLAFFVVLSRLHARLQARASLWKAVSGTYEASFLRWKRDFEGLAKLHAPWHTEHAREVPKGHYYAHDLDIPRQLYALLDGAACEASSRLLFDRMLSCALPEGDAAHTAPQTDVHAATSSGAHVHAPSTAAARSAIARGLVPNSSLHRRLEALRLQDETLQEFHAYRETGHEKIFEQAAARLGNGVPRPLRLAFAVISVAAWAVFLVPAWRTFLETASFDTLLSGLFRYAIFPLVGLVVYTPVMEGCRMLSRKSRTLLALYEAMAAGHPTQATAREATSAVVRLRSLQRSLAVLELRGNPVLWLFLHILLPFDALAAAWLEWRAGQVLPRLSQWWHDAVEFDMCVQLARFAHENPDFSFVTETPPGSALFEVEGLGHPALPATQRVDNDLTLDAARPVVLLTGSNMAGKSTFLRTLGVNVVLARLGAPVCARVFRSGIESVLCAIRVDDSLEEATSYFYAEVKRLHAILARLTHAAATGAHHRSLFLVDEIFRGTNNRERFLGSWHVIRGLLDAQGFGLVSTHDLALCELGVRDARLGNMHFREHVEGGQLAFDYKLRPGPCPTTNALLIMRIEGLPIPDNPEIAP